MEISGFVIKNAKSQISEYFDDLFSASIATVKEKYGNKTVSQEECVKYVLTTYNDSLKEIKEKLSVKFNLSNSELEAVLKNIQPKIGNVEKYKSDIYNKVSSDRLKKELPVKTEELTSAIKSVFKKYALPDKNISNIVQSIISDRFELGIFSLYSKIQEVIGSKLIIRQELIDMVRSDDKITTLTKLIEELKNM